MSLHDLYRLATTYTSRGRKIRATWAGGAYIDLTFGWHASPIEVINVWDYETGKTEVPFTRDGLRAAVAGWVAENDREAEEWADENDQPVDDWYGNYMANGA